MTPDWWKRCLAEAIGTFGLVFIGAGAICANQYSGGEIGLTGIALAHATVLLCMIYATGHISGGHINPAVTFAVAINGRLQPPLAGLYVVSQLGGAALAGYTLAGLYAPEVWTPVDMGTPTLSPEVAFSTGVFLEAIFTFLLVFTFLQVAIDERAPAGMYGLAIGLVLVADMLAGGALTGAAMNPARAFGPALASGVWSDHLVYWIGPLAGGLVAALAFRLLQPAASD
ncbi:MAG TPA: aquaporin [Acidobacteriota bacterium]|jgi:MIP family channel proteins